MLTLQGAQELDPKSSELVAETKQTVVQLKEQLDSKVSVVGRGGTVGDKYTKRGGDRSVAHVGDEWSSSNDGHKKGDLCMCMHTCRLLNYNQG